MMSDMRQEKSEALASWKREGTLNSSSGQIRTRESGCSTSRDVDWDSFGVKHGSSDCLGNLGEAGNRQNGYYDWSANQNYTYGGSRSEQNCGQQQYSLNAQGVAVDSSAERTVGKRNNQKLGDRTLRNNNFRNLHSEVCGTQHRHDVRGGGGALPQTQIATEYTGKYLMASHAQKLEQLGNPPPSPEINNNEANHGNASVSSNLCNPTVANAPPSQPEHGGRGGQYSASTSGHRVVNSLANTQSHREVSDGPKFFSNVSVAQSKPHSLTSLTVSQSLLDTRKDAVKEKLSGVVRPAENESSLNKGGICRGRQAAAGQIGHVSSLPSTNTSCVSNSNHKTADGTSKTVWRPRNKTVLSKEEELERTVKSLLNKLTIEKFGLIAEPLARTLESSLAESSEIQQIVNVVLEKAVIEPDYSEMYADLCQVLRWRSVAADGEVDARKTPFMQAFLGKIQEEYEHVPKLLNANGSTHIAYELGEPDKSEISEMERASRRIKGIVKLIGELFQRKLLGFNIVNVVVVDLVMKSDEPNERFIECFLQLISTIGLYIDQNQKLRVVLDSWFGRLTELQKKACYSRRLKCVIQDTIDMRKAEWRRKIHQDRAKALSDLRDQVETEEVLGGSIHVAQYGNIVVVGERSNLNGPYAGYLNEQEDIYKRKMGRRAEKISQKK